MSGNRLASLAHWQTADTATDSVYGQVCDCACVSVSVTVSVSVSVRV